MLNPYQVKFLEVFFQWAFSNDGFFKTTNKILTADQESPISIITSLQQIHGPLKF